MATTLAAAHVGRADGHRGSGADQQHLVEFDAGALVCIELLDTHHGTFLNAVLFTARGNHGIHVWNSESEPNGAAKEPRIVRVEGLQVKLAHPGRESPAPTRGRHAQRAPRQPGHS